MIHLPNQYKKTVRSVRLPDGRLVEVTTEPTGLTSVVQHIEDGDHLHATVRPEQLQMASAFRRVEDDDGEHAVVSTPNLRLSVPLRSER